MQPRSQSADSCRTPVEKLENVCSRTQEKAVPWTERPKSKARERLPFSDNKSNNKENFLIPETPSYKNKTPRPRNNNKNLIEQNNFENRKPRSPLMAKQLPVALDDTCK